MYETYRAWLESELRLLGNATHHAYAVGQANMAKRAIEQLDAAFAEASTADAGPVSLGLSVEEARSALDALDSTGGAVPALVVMRSRLAEALGRCEAAPAEPEA